MIKTLFTRQPPNRWFSNNFSNLKFQLKQQQPICSLQTTINSAHQTSNFLKIFARNERINQSFRSSSSSTSNATKNIDDNEEKNQNNEDDNNDDDVPLLMNFTPRGMPNIFMSLKNFYIINVVLRQKIDRSFQFKDFIEGAKQSLIYVSTHLANDQLDKLADVIEPNAFAEIRKNYEKLSIAQRQEYRLQSTDIVLCFAHHINVETMKEEFTGTRKHIVRIFIVFDCIKQLHETLQEKAKSDQQINARELFKQFHDRKIICNYEFQREYIEAINNNDQMEKSDWIITKLLHVKEKDLFKFI